MFSFGKRKKQLEVHRLIRRAVDASSPNLPPSDGELRWENRSNRTIPVLLAPFEGGELSLREMTIALTKNLSGQGLALVLHQPFRAESVVVGFWEEGEAEFVLGEVRQNVPLGGGYWQVGLELTERICAADYPALEALVPQAARLVPDPGHPAMSTAEAGPI